MLETAVVMDLRGAPLYWHAPLERTSVALPDSRTLWEVLWTHRDALAGVAHTHPGEGLPAPSWEDLTTFAAVESGLGVRLTWWIATADQVIALRHTGPGRLTYALTPDPLAAPWLAELRRRSGIHPP